VYDGAVGPVYDEVGEQSLDLTLLWVDEAGAGYAARRQGKRFFVISGKEYGPYDETYGEGPSSDVLAFGLRDAAYGCKAFWPMRRGGKWFMVSVSGEEGPYDEILTPPDTRSQMDKSSFVDYFPGQEPDIEPEGKIAFTSDGRLAAYAASRAGKWFVVANGKEGTEYDGIVPWTLEVSADGRHVCYSAKDKRGQFVVFDGVEGAAYRTRSGARVFADGARVSEAAQVASRDVSPDGRHTVRQTERMSDLQWRLARWLKRVAGISLSQPEPWRLVYVDGALVAKAREQLQYFFTADSRHIVCFGEGGGRLNLIVDGRRRALPMRYEALLQSRASDSKITAVVEREGKLVLVEITFESE
jgi:hypothetical protein